MRWQLVTWLTIQATELSDILLKNRNWKYKLSDYQRMAKGTLGHTYWQYIHDNQIEYKPNLIKHDMKHIILGYEMKMPAELDIVAFLVGNKSYNKVAVVYLLVCLLIVPEYALKLKPHYQRGQQARCLRDFDLRDFVEKDLKTIRKHLNIT
jgi:ubiquinone biosynthesis protein Coq4